MYNSKMRGRMSRRLRVCEENDETKNKQWQEANQSKGVSLTKEKYRMYKEEILGMKKRVTVQRQLTLIKRI